MICRIAQAVRERTRVVGAVASTKGSGRRVVDDEPDFTLDDVDELFARVTGLVALLVACCQHQEYGLDPLSNVAEEHLSLNPVSELYRVMRFTVPDDLQEIAPTLVGQDVRRTQIENFSETLQKRR